MSANQPHLPVIEKPKTFEYTPGGEDAVPWLVGKWPEAAAAFDLREGEVLDWHLALAGQGRPWLVIRRIFNLAPMWGDASTPDDIRAWTWAELSESIGVSVDHLKRDLQAAAEFWKKARLSLNVQRGAALQKPASTGAEQVKSLDDMADFEIHQQFDASQIATILTKYRFKGVKSEDDRLYVASRVIELKKLLEDKHTRESARQLIVMELNMAGHEMTLQVLKSRLDSLNHQRSDLTEKQSTETRMIATSIASTEKVLTTLSKTYAKAASDLGGEELEAGEVRRVAIGTISHLVQAHRDYYVSGDRNLIDGMFTAEEVVWLTTPLSIINRPAQYRPDIVERVREASLPENMWDTEFKSASFAGGKFKTHRDASRRLQRLASLLAEDEMEPGPIEGIDDAEVSAEESEDPAEAAAHLGQSADAAISPTSDYSTPTPRPDEPCMGIG